jgi:hypothetical protein
LFVTLSLTGPRDGSSAARFSLGGVLRFPSVVSSLKTEMPRGLGAMLSMRAVKRMINVRGDEGAGRADDFVGRSSYKDPLNICKYYLYVIV